MKTFIIFLSFVLGLTSISTTASPLADCYATKAGASTKNYTYSYSGGATADSNIYEILKESERAYGGILNGAERVISTIRFVLFSTLILKQIITLSEII